MSGEKRAKAKNKLLGNMLSNTEKLVTHRTFRVETSGNKDFSGKCEINRALIKEKR
jgi:hypothetical protein